ncbi:MAG: MBL fold metallo-hydrolase [Candidatus Riflebacteria bacterium]|nr:MBL fold metallo-hydrolase [Candidatus Riflebacteria bacterium]
MDQGRTTASRTCQPYHRLWPGRIPWISLLLVGGVLTWLVPAAVTAAGSRTLVVILGTGSPVPDPDRSGPSLAIVVGGNSYLVDCGVGCVRRAVAAFQKKGIEALRDSNLKVCFITHLHSDHTLGYPDLMLTPWDRRSGALRVYGPPGTSAMTENILRAYAADIQVRTKGLQGSSVDTVTPEVHEIASGVIFKDGSVTVTAFPVTHGTFPNSFGFKFVSPDRTVVISGDTAASDAIVEQARGADVLIHEVYSMEKYARVPPQTRQYLRAFHTSTEELAVIANKARPKLLVPIHKLGHAGLSAGAIKRELRKAGYTGRVADSHDLDIY